MVDLIFFGTPEIARAPLAALISSNIARVIAVVSQPDRPSGRDLKMQPTPVKALASEKGIPVLQPERARHPEFIQQLRALKPHVIVVMAYGQILPADLLEIPTHGCVNIHTSILPKYRGAAPIQWAILNGESETGVTLIKMDAGMDTGPIISIVRTPITAEDTGQTLHDRLGDLGAKLLLQTLPGYLSGNVKPQPQPEGSTHARKITKEDGRLNWDEPAIALFNRIRAFNPWPSAYTFLPDKKLLKIWKSEVIPQQGRPGEILEAGKDTLIIAAGDQALRLLELQREGSRRLSAREFLQGNPLTRGQRLG